MFTLNLPQLAVQLIFTCQSHQDAGAVLSNYPSLLLVPVYCTNAPVSVCAQAWGGWNKPKVMKSQTLIKNVNLQI